MDKNPNVLTAAQMCESTLLGSRIAAGRETAILKKGGFFWFQIVSFGQRSVSSGFPPPQYSSLHPRRHLGRKRLGGRSDLCALPRWPLPTLSGSQVCLPPLSFSSPPPPCTCCESDCSWGPGRAGSTPAPAQAADSLTLSSKCHEIPA